MKPHLKILSLIPSIDCILAVQSLLPWAGAFNEFNEGEYDYKTVASESAENSKVLTSTVAGHEIVVVATTDESTKVVATKNIVQDPALCGLLSALGLSATVGNLGVTFDAIDVEILDSRHSTLDGVWCLMRRIKHFESEDSLALESTFKILQFANEWQLSCLQALEGEASKSPQFLKREETLEARAKAFKSWGVKGLEGLTLKYDPRCSTLELKFESFHPNHVGSNNFNWPVGKSAMQAVAMASRKSTYGKFEVRPTRIPEDVQGVLNGLVINGCEVKIVEQLAKKLYDKVNETLTTIGGEWTKGRQAHVFESDPSEMIDRLIETGEIFTRRDFEFFETQPEQVGRVSLLASISVGMKVMEPNAGKGALAMAAAEVVGKENVKCYELMPENVDYLNRLGFSVDAPTDFLQVKPDPIYDRIIANPPFSNGRDVAHIMHAMQFLKPGGILVAIASTQWQTHDTKSAEAFREYLANHGAHVEQIEAGAFKAVGTGVSTTLIAIKKPAAVEKPAVKHKPSRAFNEQDQMSFVM